MGCAASSARTYEEGDHTRNSGSGGTKGHHDRLPSTADSSVDPDEQQSAYPAHAYCGLPGADRGPPGYLGTDPHQAGWLAGKWTASADDAERVDALRKLGILLTEREEAFDRLTKLGSQLMKTPICLISFVDEEEQWFKAAVGLEDPGTGRDAAFCTYTTLREMPGVFVVLNAPADTRFAKNPLVTGPPYISFYAGAPIYHPDSDLKVGSFCVISDKPRQSFSESEKRTLQMLADMVQHELVSRATRIAHENKARVLMTLSSEMRDTQRTLEASIVNYRNLIESANAPIFAVDNSQRYGVTLWNKRMSEMTGVPTDAAIGQGIVDVLKFMADGSAGVEAQRRELIRALLLGLDSPADKAGGDGGVPEQVTTHTVGIALKAPAGANAGVDGVINLQLVLTPIMNDSQTVTGVVCIGEDVSHRLRASGGDAAVPRTAAPPTAVAAPTPASSAPASPPQAATMPPEMRAPLEGLVRSLDHAMGDADMRQAAAGRWVRQAWTVGKVLVNIMNDEVDAERIASGSLTLAQEIFTPHEASDVCLALVAPSAETKGLKLLVHMDSSLRQVFVRGDPHRIVRCLASLMLNAIDSSDKGDIALRMWLGTASGAEGKDPYMPAAGDRVSLYCEVKDSGSGVPPPEVAAVFKGEPRGVTGMAVARALASRMGGSLTLESAPGKGTTATLSILIDIATPAAAASEHRATGPFDLGDSADLVTSETVSAGPSRGQSVAGRGQNVITRQVDTGAEAKPAAADVSVRPSDRRANVFAADDSEYNIDVARNMLEMLGHKVTTAHNGRAAVDKVAAFREAAASDPTGNSDIHVILMDCDMPVMDGFDSTVAIRRMEEERGWSRVPIIAFTAYASSDTRAKCFESGMDDYLTKPYSLASLRTKLAVHLQVDKLPAAEAQGAAAAAAAAPQGAAAAPTPGPAKAGADKAGKGQPKEAAAVPAAARGDSEVDRMAASIYKELSQKQVVNEQQMQAIFGGNKQLMTQAVTMFVNTSKAVPGNIETALGNKDFEKLHRTVHQCKGSAGYIGAERVHNISLELQQAARDLQTQQQAAADPASVNASPKVKAQVHVLTRCLNELLAELSKMQLE